MGVRLGPKLTDVQKQKIREEYYNLPRNSGGRVDRCWRIELLSKWRISTSALVKIIKEE